MRPSRAATGSRPRALGERCHQAARRLFAAGLAADEREPVLDQRPAENLPVAAEDRVGDRLVGLAGGRESAARKKRTAKPRSRRSSSSRAISTPVKWARTIARSRLKSLVVATISA